MAAADIDRNLLFGVIALQDDLIDERPFIDACAVWALRLERPLAEVLMERHFITDEDRREIERKIARKIKKHGPPHCEKKGNLVGRASVPADLGQGLPFSCNAQ